MKDNCEHCTWEYARRECKHCVKASSVIAESRRVIKRLCSRLRAVQRDAQGGGYSFYANLPAELKEAENFMSRIAPMMHGTMNTETTQTTKQTSNKEPVK